MRKAITAICSALPTNGNRRVPAEICYVPEGKRKIYPLSHPDGVWVDLPSEKGEAIAAAFNQQLGDLGKETVKPWLDFEHTGKYPSAGIPTAFRYEKGKGLMCAVDWSVSGRKAIRGKDVGYFSPRVDIDENGVPCGLPERGPLGGLVTEPAFRDMPAIAASSAQHPNLDTNMSLLAACGLLTPTEAALDNAQITASSRVTALKGAAERLATVEASLSKAEKDRDEWKDKFEKAETAAKANREKVAKEKVSAAVAAGKILANDTVTQQYFTERVTAGDAISEQMLEKLPVLNNGIDKPTVTAGADRTVTGGGKEHAFVTEARSLITAGEAKSEGAAFTILAGRKPDLYEDYSKSLTVQS